jgi:hypothetical protein
LNEAGFREQVTAAAIEAAVASGVQAGRNEGITEPRSGRMMKTSRAQMDRLLDQWQFDAEETRAAKVVNASQGRSFDAQESFAKRASPQASTPATSAKFGWFRAGAQTAKIHTARMAPSVARPLMVQPAT